MTNKNKEIEFGVKIKNGDEVKDYLKEISPKERIITISRDIYKNDSKYFLKVSEENENNQSSAVFSLKEDLLALGTSEGMKVADEVDVDVSKEQLEKLVNIVSFLGFEKKSHFKKIRYQYEVEGTMVMVDEYDKVTNLEVEGETEEKVMKVVKQIPYIALEEK